MAVGETFAALPGSWKKALGGAIPDIDAIQRIWVAERGDGHGPASAVAATDIGVCIAKIPPGWLWPEVVFFYFDEIRAVESNLAAPGAHSEVYIFTPYAPRPGFGLFDSRRERDRRGLDRRGRRFAEPNLISFDDPEAAEDLVHYTAARVLPPPARPRPSTLQAG